MSETNDDLQRARAHWRWRGQGRPPWADVDRSLLQPAPGGSFCEWKGPARYWSLVQGPHRDVYKRQLEGLVA